jgi:hypothetical protein
MANSNAELADHSRLVIQSAENAAAIGVLGSRVTSLESTLSHVQDKVMSLDSKVASGFSTLESLIREGKAGQGPGLAEILKGVATGGAIIAMSAGAITMLVTSFVKPELVEITATVDQLQKIDTQRSEAERQELLALRERRRQMIDEQLKDLADRDGWAANVTRGKLCRFLVGPQPRQTTLRLTKQSTGVKDKLLRRSTTPLAP